MSIHKDSQNEYNVGMEEIHLKPGEIVKITPDMIIGDVIAAYPEIIEVLEKKGFHCIGCYASMYESIEEGALVHKIDPKKLCSTINKTIQKHRKK